MQDSREHRMLHLHSATSWWGIMMVELILLSGILKCVSAPQGWASVPVIIGTSLHVVILVPKLSKCFIKHARDNSWDSDPRHVLIIVSSQVSELIRSIYGINNNLLLYATWVTVWTFSFSVNLNPTSWKSVSAWLSLSAKDREELRLNCRLT